METYSAHPNHCKNIGLNIDMLVVHRQNLSRRCTIYKSASHQGIIQVIKNIMTKAKENGENPSLGVSELRHTGPDGYTYETQLHMSHQLRYKLSCTLDRLRKKLPEKGSLLKKELKCRHIRTFATTSQPRL